MNERGREVSQLADTLNKKSIDEQLSVTSAEWQELVSGLEGRRDALELLSRHWEELEARWSQTETRVNVNEERSKLVDSVVRSKQQLRDTIKGLDVSFLFIRLPSRLAIVEGDIFPTRASRCKHPRGSKFQAE